MSSSCCESGIEGWRPNPSAIWSGSDIETEAAAVVCWSRCCGVLVSVKKNSQAGVATPAEEKHNNGHQARATPS
jgi:hypothetical protein